VTFESVKSKEGKTDEGVSTVEGSDEGCEGLGYTVTGSSELSGIVG